jgi:tRNA threonylcarbamoyl adenosine modification protein (Sua5/YciO/YrdC/YwlC family)
MDAKLTDRQCRILPAGENALGEAKAALLDGQTVAIPTETVYGLAADATNGEAVARIFESKQRPSFNPLICHVSGIAMAETFASFDPLSRKLAAHFWPGALTLVLPLKEGHAIHPLVTAGLDTVAVRAPKGFGAELIEAVGRPLAAPSANRSGRISPTTAQAVADSLGDTIGLVIDGGPTQVGVESTIIKVEESKIHLLRPGGVAAEDIEAVAGQKLTRAEANAAIQAPGMLASHYAPNARDAAERRPCRGRRSAARLRAGADRGRGKGKGSTGAVGDRRSCRGGGKPVRLHGPAGCQRSALHRRRADPDARARRGDQRPAGARGGAEGDNMRQADLITKLGEIAGETNVLTGDDDTAPYLKEWRNRWTGKTAAVVRPGSTQEVAAILKLASKTKTPVVPQGGNTGLVGGQIPDMSGKAIILSTSRLNRIRAIDPAGNTITVEAGVVLQAVQEAADEHGRLFPLSLGSQGSCQIGGNLSTNAGGTGALAHGVARDLCLGLEVVLPTGEILDDLNKLKKDNTGYNLRNLFIGAEGTLGVITAAVLKLFPKPAGRATAFVALPSPEEALALFAKARDVAGTELTAFELMARIGVEFTDPPHRGRARSPRPPSSLVCADGNLVGPVRGGRAGETGGRARTRHGARPHNRRGDRREFPTARRFLAAARRHVGKPDPGGRVDQARHLGAGRSCAAVSRRGGQGGAGHRAGLARVRLRPSRRRQHPLQHFPAGGRGPPSVPDADRGDHARGARHRAGAWRLDLGRTRHRPDEARRTGGTKSPVALDLMRRIKKDFDPKGIMNPGKVL